MSVKLHFIYKLNFIDSLATVFFWFFLIFSGTSLYTRVIMSMLNKNDMCRKKLQPTINYIDIQLFG